MDRQSAIYDSSSTTSFPSFSSFTGLNTQLQSPYLQFDPNVIQSQQPQSSSEFIFPDGASRHSRGRFELAFSQIGSSVMSGAAIGGSIGAFKGLRSLQSMSSQSINASLMMSSLSVKRSQILNYMTKNGASMANQFGSIALIYSTIGVGLSFIQDKNDDLNTIIAATTTGAVYNGLSSTTTTNIAEKLWRIRVKRSLIGSLLGASAALIYVTIVNKDKYFK